MQVDSAIFERMGFDEGKSTWVLGSLMPLPYLLDYTLRLCPACLNEQPYHRRIWDLRHVERCPRHRTPLLTHCPDCNGVLRWSRWSLTACHCGHALTSSGGAGNIVECDIEEIIYAMAGVPGHSFDLPAFEGVPLLQMLELLLFLGRMIEVAAAENPDQLLRRKLFTDRGVLAGGLAIARDWPESFDGLASKVRSGRPKETGVSRQYGPLHRFIEKHGDEPYGDALRQAYRDHLIQRGDIESKAFPTFLNLPPGFKCFGADFVGREDLRAKLGHNDRAFSRLLNGPWGQMLRPVPGAGTGLPVYRRSDVDTFVQKMGNLISFREADRMLGLSPDSTRELIAAGLIDAPPKLTKSKIDGSALDRCVIMELLDRVRSMSTAPRPRNPIPFRSVLDGIVRRRAGRIPELLKALLDGELRGYCTVQNASQNRGGMNESGLLGLIFEESAAHSFFASLVIRARGVRWSSAPVTSQP